MSDFLTINSGKKTYRCTVFTQEGDFLASQSFYAKSKTDALEQFTDWITATITSEYNPDTIEVVQITVPIHAEH